VKRLFPAIAKKWRRIGMKLKTALLVIAAAAWVAMMLLMASSVVKA
jgi:hypothetical protein